MSLLTFALPCFWIFIASRQVLSKYMLDFHPLFSDSFSEIFSAEGFPVKGSLEYYATLALRDRSVHGRRLTSVDSAHSLLNFADGNETHRFSAFGFLNYAKISVGTPKKIFMVALDTGSDMLWLPCDCSSCVHGLKMPSGPDIKLEIYSPAASTTSAVIPCKSKMCTQGERTCSQFGALDHCPYKVVYLSNGTSSAGILVEDVLHLISHDASKSLDAHIIFGCGQTQTGIFVEGAAPNGLLGLGAAPMSIPSTLASQGLISNSFSMCFGVDGRGRILFGDEGGSNQGETPFNFQESNPIYNITIIGLQVGEATSDVMFPAIFDSGTSFTYLNDPAYARITESFDSQTRGRKLQHQKRDIPFEFCYGLSESDANFTAPNVVLTMGGGDEFTVIEPATIVSTQGEYLFCLGLIRSSDINIIGQNFMAGYEMVFDRERAVLGWKESNCYDEPDLRKMSPLHPWNTSAMSPAVAVDPEEKKGSERQSSSPSSHPRSGAFHASVNFVLCLHLIHTQDLFHFPMF